MTARRIAHRAVRLLLRTWSFRLSFAAALLVAVGFATRIPVAARGEAATELFVVAQNVCAFLQALAAGVFVLSTRASDEATWIAANRGASKTEIRRAHLLGGAIAGALIGILPIVFVALPCFVLQAIHGEGQSVALWLRTLVGGAAFGITVTLLSTASTAFFSLFVGRDALAWTLTLLFAPELLRMVPGLTVLPPAGFLQIANGVRWGITDASFGASQVAGIVELAFVIALATFLTDRRARKLDRKAKTTGTPS